MSILLNDYSISISRGDSLNKPLFVNVGSDDFPVRLDFRLFKDIEIIFLIITRDSCPKSILTKQLDITRTNDYGDILVTLTSQDTRDLPSGIYDYVVTGRMFDEMENKIWMYTIISPTTMVIT